MDSKEGNGYISKDHRPIRVRKMRRQTWKTPKKLYEELDREFHFDFDPCTEKQLWCALTIPWGKMNFINPPYCGDKIYQFLKKGLEEFWDWERKSIFLLPSRTGTAWFHELVLYYKLEVRWIRGRVKFDDCGMNAPFDSLLVIVR